MRAGNYKNLGGINMFSFNCIKRRPGLLLGASVAASLMGAAAAQAADTTYEVVAGQVVSGQGNSSPVINASPAAGDTFTIENEGTIRTGAAATVNRQAIGGNGAGEVIINNNGRLQSRLSFGAAAGPVTLNNNTGGNPETTGWHVEGLVAFGSGDDAVVNAAGADISTGGATTFAFGDGDDTFSNAGRLFIGRSGSLGPAGRISFTGLETFENTGAILLGASYNKLSNTGAMDGLARDVFDASGVDFVGGPGSQIWMDVLLGPVEQPDCVTLVTADCAMFTGGTTSGATGLVINDPTNVEDAAYNDGITVVVGASAAEHFFIDPQSDYYVAQTSNGPAVQKRLIAYHLVYDEATQRHMLVGALADEALQSATFAASAQETWRASTGDWFKRQADLRDAPDGLKPSYGTWGRVSGALAKREGETSFTSGGHTLNYDLDYKTTTGQMVFGTDILGSAGQDSAWVVGGMLGFVRTDAQYDATPTEIVYSGFTGGVYGTYVAGPLFIDAIVNGNLLKMDGDVPNMHLNTENKLTQDISSLGVQVEAGWRAPLAPGAFVEPLVSVSYVKTKFEDIDVPGGAHDAGGYNFDLNSPAGAFDFDDSYTSLRLGAGVRAGMATELFGLATSYSLTARYWNEMEGENGTTVIVASEPDPIPLMDDFSGAFGELSGGVNIYTDDGFASGYVSIGGKFGDDYRSLDGSVGVRLRW